MDAYKKTSYEAEDRAPGCEPTNTPEGAGNGEILQPSAPCRRSVESEAFSTDADEDPLSNEMDGGDAYRRRKAQLMGEHEDNHRDGRKGRKKGRRQRQRQESKRLSYRSEDGHSSDFSTSDDVELDHLSSDGILSEDEETGLTKNDKRHRKKRRTRDTDLDARIGGSSQTSQLRQKIADQNVLKVLALNSLLVVSWYLFSLSISIVSDILSYV